MRHTGYQSVAPIIIILICPILIYIIFLTGIYIIRQTSAFIFHFIVVVDATKYKDKDKDLFIIPQEFVVGHSKAPEQPQSSARPICHSDAMTTTGHEPITIFITYHNNETFLGFSWGNICTFILLVYRDSDVRY